MLHKYDRKKYFSPYSFLYLCTHKYCIIHKIFDFNVSARKYFVPTKRKTELMYMKNLAPLLYIQSDCDTASNRDIYVAELMKYIEIDSYGKCLNNAQFDKR